ncbi:MAG: hypothetical protein ACYC7J_05745 [Syntrophales bacterium]
MTVRRTLVKAVLCSAALLGLFSTASATVPLGTQPAEVFTGRLFESGHRIAVAKILSALAVRSADGRALGKAADKLANMNDRDLRLISSLCDRISADRGTASADLAFSLVTALIVLS